MSWYSFAIRPINWVRDERVRAASPHTSDWGIKSLARRASIAAIAFENILQRVGQNPELAGDVLTGEFSLAEKVRVINALISSPEFQRQLAHFSSAGESPAPPEFFLWLSKQPQAVVDQIHQLWSYFDRVQPGEHVGLVAMDAPPTTEYARNATTTHPGLKVFYSFEFTRGTDPRDPKNTIGNSHEVDGYEIGDKEFYLIRRPIELYQWTVDDVFRVFHLELNIPHYQKRLLSKVITKGFFTALEVRQFRPKEETIAKIRRSFEIAAYSTSHSSFVLIIRRSNDNPRIVEIEVNAAFPSVG